MISNRSGSMQKTKDYSMFKILNENRQINKLHINKLICSLKEDNDLHLNPIIVSSDFEVIDGQHRLQAAKELGLEIYYVIDENFSPYKIITLNTTQKKWGAVDYLNFWKTQGREDYINLEKFKEDIEFSLPCLINWIGKDTGENYAKFREGKFKFFLSEELLDAMYSTKEIIEILKKQNIKPVKMLTHTNLHHAFRKFFMSGLVDFGIFRDKLEKTPYVFKYCNGWHGYFQQLVEIYNYKSYKNRLTLKQDGKRMNIEKD